MTSNLETEYVIERAEDFLTHHEGIEETSSSEVRQPGGLSGRRKKLDAEDYIVSREHNGQIIKIHFDENVADQTKRNVKTKVLQNSIGKLIVDTRRECDLKTDSFHLVPCNIITPLSKCPSQTRPGEKISGKCAFGCADRHPGKLYWSSVKIKNITF